MADFYGDRLRADNRRRAGLVKAHVRFDDAIKALGLDRGPGPACLYCRAAGALVATHDGTGFYCRACASKGDVLDFAMEARKCGFNDAVAFLMRECIAPEDAETGELF